MDSQASPTLDRLLAWSLDHPLPAPSRYALATMLVVTTALLRMLLITNLLPYLLFIPVVLLIALTMGRKTGLYATWLSGIMAGATLASADNAWWLTGMQWIATLLYTGVMTGVALTAAELRGAFRRSQRLRMELATANGRLLDHQEQLRLVNRELGHRLKNQLTIVQAIAGQTLRRSLDVKAANEALNTRLAAFGRATDMLTAADWRSADLHKLAEAALGSEPELAGRIHISGPPVSFNPQISLAVALALHELMTNATKYGALSVDRGHVELHWTLAADGDGDRSRFNLIWREIGGPPVSPPTRQGFGSFMIERSLSSYFGSRKAIAYDPAGLVFSIDAVIGAEHMEAATGSPLH
ncbi:sensor histidine kinase [uncultured Sphingomonas sp.]|uniref:sensor histidine kinase n=1 Tax=uncultured Sphingomonas sp. TaxID=158754 RepID=UPI0025D32C00|nr:sensor histidine kinase [uncultured Sphingomonas sp.]